MRNIFNRLLIVFICACLAFQGLIFYFPQWNNELFIILVADQNGEVNNSENESKKDKTENIESDFENDWLHSFHSSHLELISSLFFHAGIFRNNQSPLLSIVTPPPEMLS